jgi:hypothetical protein
VRLNITNYPTLKFAAQWVRQVRDLSIDGPWGGGSGLNVRRATARMEHGLEASFVEALRYKEAKK